MRKIFLALTAMTLMLPGCSGSDDSSSVDNNNNNNNPTFESTILIDGEGFSPTTTPFSVTTSFIEGSGEINNTRAFNLVKVSTNLAAMEMMQIVIDYPSSQSSINGTYSFDFFNSDHESDAGGGYSVGQSSYTFEDGTITVTDLGNNKFKLQFNNAIMEDFDETETITVTGYFEGTFHVQ